MNEKISDIVIKTLERYGGKCLNPACDNNNPLLFMLKGSINLGEDAGPHVYCRVCKTKLELDRKFSIKDYLEVHRIKFLREFKEKHKHCQCCGNTNPLEFTPGIRFDSKKENPLDYAKKVKHDKTVMPQVRFTCNECGTIIEDGSELGTDEFELQIRAMEKFSRATGPFKDIVGIINNNTKKETPGV